MSEYRDNAFRSVGFLPILVTAALFCVVGAMAADGVRALWLALWSFAR